MKIIFAGTPEFAARHLQALIASNHHICAVYTQPDRPAGRGKKLSPSAVKTLAEEHNIPVMQPVSLKTEDAQQKLSSFECDLMVVVAYGLLLPEKVLHIPRSGCINVHGSLLPRWRGAAPIQRAIESGDRVSGITIMQMDVGLDTGAMLLKSECPILPDDTSADLHDRLCEIGPPALLKTIGMIEGGTLAAEKQDDSLSNYASKIEKSEAKINWHEAVAVIERKIRAFNPFPICFTEIDDTRLRIYRATKYSDQNSQPPGQVEVAGQRIVVQCGDGQLSLEQLQLPGKKAMSAQALLNGFSHLFDQSPRPVIFGNDAPS